MTSFGNAVRQQVQDENTALPRAAESKFRPPQPPPEVQPLARLEDRFSEMLEHRLVSVIAPAGYGKTTTLVGLHGAAIRKGMAAGWITLDCEDNDPNHFLRFVAECLQRILPVFPQEDAAPGRFQSDASDALFPAVCEWIAKADAHVVLFFDDYHLIRNEAVHAMLDWLMQNGPDNLSMVVGSRSSLRQELVRLRLAGKVVEIDARDLALNAVETARFVQSNVAWSLEDSQIDQLHSRTEGWIAGLKLACSAMKRVDSVDRFIEEFSGCDRDITAYLGELVLRQLPADVSSFLMRSALFDRLSAQFCRDVLREEQAEECIEAIHSNGLFLVPLDRSGEWLRYHQLLADLLRKRFMLSDPDEARTLFERASKWFEERKSTNEAIRYALAAQAHERAADLIAAAAFEMVQVRGEHVTLLTWTAMLPRSCVEKRLRLRVAIIWCLLFTHSYRAAELEIAAIEATLAAAPEAGEAQSNPRRSLSAKVMLARCVLHAFADNPPLAGEIGRHWLERWEESGDAGDVSTALNAMGYRRFIERDYHEALCIFQRSKTILEGDAAGAQQGLAWVEMFRALTSYEKGWADEGKRIVTTALQTFARTLGPRSNGTSILSMLHAQLCYEQNLVAEAEQALASNFALVTGRSFGESSTVAYLAKARILWLAGDADQAQSYLEKVAGACRALGLRRMSGTLNAERIHLYLRSGQREKAESLAGLTGMTSADGRHPNDDLAARLAGIRIDLMSGATVGALERLDAELAAARSEGRGLWVTRLLCIKASAMARAGDRESALRLLRQAIELGSAGTLVRSIVDETGDATELLRQVIDEQRKMASGGARNGAGCYLDMLMIATGIAGVVSPAPQTGPREPTLLEPDRLSARELQVLRLVERGWKNRDMAVQLLVSEETVKWHLRNVYSKLKVGNRTSALARARALGML